MQKFVSLLLILAITIFIGGCQVTITPPEATTVAPDTPDATGTATLSATSAITPTVTLTTTESITLTVEITATPPITGTSVATGTSALTATQTITSLPTTTSTAALTVTQTATPTLAITGTPNAISTPTVTATQSVTSTAATTATQTVTATAAVSGSAGVTGTSAITTGQLISVPTLPADLSNLTIAQIISTTSGFSTLATALDQAGLTSVLNGPGPLTLFAPTDNAFAIYPTSTVNSLLADPTLLNQVLQYHVVVDSSALAQLLELGGALTYMGEQVTISVDAGGTYRVNDAIILQSDIQASNGVIHVINGLLVPSTAQSLLSARTVTQQAETDTGTRPLTLEELAAEDTSALTVMDVIRSIDGFTTLVAAADATGLNTALSTNSAVTLFAPTNGAFAELPTGTLESLLNTQPSQLLRILQYHTVVGRVPAAQLAQFGTVLTATGDPITVTVSSDGVISLNGGAATVFVADIEASNGIVHAISTVLMPPPEQ